MSWSDKGGKQVTVRFADADLEALDALVRAGVDSPRRWQTSTRSSVIQCLVREKSVIQCLVREKAAARRTEQERKTPPAVRR